VYTICDIVLICPRSTSPTSTLALSLLYRALPLGSAYLNALSALLAQAQLYAYEIGMSALGLSGLVLCSTWHATVIVRDARWEGHGEGLSLPEKTSTISSVVGH
jgi:hypothetical protein